MTALAIERQTPKMGQDAVINLISFPVLASTKIYGGSLVVLTAAGLAKPGATAPGLVAIGMAEATADNSSGASSAIQVRVRQGVFKFANSAAGVDLVAAANYGQPCYIVDDNVVALTSAAGTRSVAGIVVQVDTDGVWVQVGLVNSANQPPALDRQVRCVARGNITLATGLVAGQTIDGVTLVAGDRVLLANQTSAGTSGVYIATAAGTGAMAPDYANGYVKAGMVFEVSEGTIGANQSWKITAAQASPGGYINVGTTDPIFMPRMDAGSTAIGTAVSTLFIAASGSPVALNDITSSTTGTKAVLVAGRGNGSITLTGTGTDTVKFGIFNW